MVTPADILARLRAAGVVVSLRPDGRVETRGRVPAELVSPFVQHRDAIALELRRVEESAPESGGELAAIDREAATLRRVSLGLGPEVDAVLWRVLDRLDLAAADQVWRAVENADRRGILSKLVAWLRSLDAAGTDGARVRTLIAAGPGQHHYDDEGAP